MLKKHVNASGTVWQVYGRARIEGKSAKVYVGSFQTEREAKKADEDHRARQRLVADGELPAAADPRRTLGQALEAWLKHLGELTTDDPGHRSHDEYASRIANHVPAALKNTPLVKVTEAKLVKLRGELQRADGTGAVSRKMANAVMQTLSSAMSWFVSDKKWIAVHPWRAVKPFRVTRRAYEWIRSAAEITKLLAECHENIRSLVAVLVGTGLRLDEALHLEWSDVDLKNRLLHVHRGRKGPTKSGKARHVPIGDAALPVLRELKLAAGKSVLVWPGANRDKSGRQLPRDKSGIFRPFKAAALRAGLSPKLRVHDLRHTFASHYMMGGGDIFRLSKILGHSSVRITEETYAHLSPEAHVADYGRVTFAMPSDGKVLSFRATPATPAT